MNKRILNENRRGWICTLLLLCCLFFQVKEVSAESLQTGSINVTGVVTDSKGETIIGASVVEVGTTNGTITGIDGDFSIQVAPGAKLRITYIGYKEKEYVITKSTSLKVTLEEDSKLIDEVVVVGYGTQKKANLTGSVAAVNFTDVASMPVANTANMLQGRLPGVMLTNNGAQAGKDTPEIRIRGVGTLSDNNNPMVLIDGVESSVSQISEIPADDIETVSVLKDAASASIYGVRAANGVILVTTKRGMEQKPQISYSGNIVLQTPTVLPSFLNSADWAQMYNEAHNSNTYTAEMIQKLRDGSDPDHFANTDWADALFRNALMHQHHLSVNGGSQNVRYMLSAQYFNQDGILEYTGNKRYNFRSNVDATLGRVKLGLNLAGSKQEIEEPVTSVDGSGLMRYLSWSTRPTVPVKYSNGHWGCVDGSSLSQSQFKNPLEEMSQGNKENDQYRFDGKVFGELDIIDGLKFRSSLAYKYYMQTTSAFSPKNTLRYDAEGNVLNTIGTNSLKDYHYIESTYINENILTYDWKIKSHSFNFLAGHSIQAYRMDKNESSKQGFPTDNIYEMDGGTSNDKVTGSAKENSLQSFFGRINYNFADRYLFEVNIRHDGSSRMPKAHRYATFPSFSGAWIMTNEKFLEDVKFLSSLKLRASWGKLGNQEIGDYAYTSLLAADGNYYFGSTKNIGLRPKAVANDDIKWETTTITDFGVDASFWQGRISTTFDWFDKNTSDILLQLPMPSSYLGTLSAPYQNAGEVRNRGWELSANYFDQKGDFSWQAGFSLSAVKNKILDMRGVENISNNTINREGAPIGSYYGLKAVGLYRTEADLNRTTIVDGKEVVITQFNQKPSLGDIMYEDVNGDGNITDDDRDIIGNPFPKMQYSFNLGFAWKNLDLSMFWQGVSGLYRYNWDETTTWCGNRTIRWEDHYTEDNPNGSMPRLGNTFNDKYSSFWLSKVDYLRLKNLEIGYTFRQPQLGHFGIQSIRLYLAGTNLLTFTPLDDYDPEKKSSDSRNDVHPNTRTYSFGVNVKF